MTKRTQSEQAAYNEGDSAAYYGRQCNPHERIGPYTNPSGVKSDKTKSEIAAYYLGFDENPSDRKDYG